MAREQQEAALGSGQALVPLWVKLSLAFGLSMAAALAAFGWYDFQRDLVVEARRRQARLTGLARSLAAAVDGDGLARFLATEDMDTPAYGALYRRLCAAVDDNDLMYASVLTSDDRGRLAYVIDGTTDAPLPLGFPVFDVSAGHRRALEGASAFIAGWQDEWGRYDSAFAPIRDGQGAVVALLELDADADARDWLIRARARRLLVQIGLGMVLAMGMAVLFARYLNRHLMRLTRSARALAAGDLSQRVHIRTRDEIGLLGRAFDAMAQGLQEREFIRETFGRFVTPEVVRRLLSDPRGPHLGGELRTVTILMSDLRGFTSLCESMAPEPMLALLNRYLTRMADVIMAWGGTISEFTGDGIVAFFGAPEAREDDAQRALACALDMQRALARFNVEEGRPLQMGIGVNSGPVVAGNIGSERRMKYGVVGDAINVAARLEGAAVGGQVLISAASLEAAGAAAEAALPLSLRVKGKRVPLTALPLLGMGAPYDLRLPEGEDLTVPVQLTARCRRVEGKRVGEELPEACVTRMGCARLVLVAPWPLTLEQHLGMDVELGEGRLAEELYGKVVTSRAPAGEGEPWIATVALTSVPEPARRLIEALVAG